MQLHDIDPEAELQGAPRVLARFKRALNLSMAAVIGLGLVFFAQQAGPWTQALAIQPGKPAGLIGIVAAPLLHGSLGHLASNAFSILVLGTLAGTVFPRASLRALPVIWVGSGLGTWLIGSGGFHLGASGVTHGLGFLIFTLALLRRDRPAISAALIAFFFFGGMLLTVLPQELGVSWEYHLSGAVMGVIAGLRWRRLDPAPPRRRYSWEDEEEMPEAANEEVLELPRPDDVPVLWQRPEEVKGQVIPFRRRNNPDS
jgi:membrane associated rhomboid family serine protease